MRHRACAALVVVAAASPPAVADLDVIAGNGDVAAGTLSPGSEAETFRYVIPRDAQIRVAVKGVKGVKGGAAVPKVTFALFDPDGTAVGADRIAVKGTGAKVRKLTAPKSGTYRLVVTGDGAEGDYTATLAWASRTSFPLTPQLPGDPKRFAFAADAGATASIKVKAGKGASPPRLLDVRDAADVPVFQFPPPADGATTHAAKSVALGAGGELTLSVGGAGDDPFTGAITVKAPKPPKRRLSFRAADLPAGVVGDAVIRLLGLEGGLVDAGGVGAISGASVSIPPRALSGPTAVTVGGAEYFAPDVTGLVEGGPPVFFGPEGFVFPDGKLATITLPYVPTRLFGGAAAVRVFTRAADGTVSEVTPITVEEAYGRVTFTVSHFSSFLVVGPPRGQQMAKLVPAGALAGDRGGSSCALDGARLIAGEPFGDAPQAPADTGTAHVYVESDLTWTEEQLLAASDADAGDRFGEAVALDGTAVVGAPLHTHDGVTQCGTVYLFDRTGSTWQETTELRPPVPLANSGFGAAVAFSGDAIVVGAPQDRDAQGFQTGAVYVFRLFGASWDFQTKIVPPNTVAGSGAGSAVDIYGDTLVIGKSGGSGAVWVYTLNGGNWSLQQELASDAPVVGDAFGRFSVAVEDHTLVVGMPRTGQSGNPVPETYVFVRSGTTWTKQQILSTGNPPGYGKRVAISNDLVAVGAPDIDGSEGPTYGIVFLYGRVGGVWDSRGLVAPRDPGTPKMFGSAISLNPERSAFGAPGDASGRGATYVFDRAP